MAADTGMSLKERLALLQSNNKNPQLSGPMKSPTHMPLKTTTPTSPVNKTPDHGDKPNGPLSALKPVVKPPPSGDTAAKNSNEENTTQFPVKLRSTGAQLGGKGLMPPVAIKPSGGTGVKSEATKSDSSPTGAFSPPGETKKLNDFHGNVTPFVPKKQNGVDESVETAAVATKDKSSASGAPGPPSLKERMAALREKAGDVDSGNISGPKSPNPEQKKVSLFFPKADGISVKPSDLVKSLHEAARKKKASEVFIRKSDGKRFRKVDMATVIEKSPDPAPPKPLPISNVNLVTFLKAYAAAKESKLTTDAAKGDTGDTAGRGEEEGEMEELYVQAESETVQLRVRGRGSVKRAYSVRVSEIPEFTEEEEEQELCKDGLSAGETVCNISEETYDDCASALAAVQSQRQSEVEEQDEVYEPLDEVGDSKPGQEPALPGPADDRKAGKMEKEKEGKKDKKKDKSKEEANKKEEKERKKKEEELKKQRAKFGLKEGDEKVGEGVVKNNANSGVFKKDLAVNKGEIVAILRMDNNPSGKWLVQNDQGKLGFVSSSNIEVATPAIRQSFIHTMIASKLLHMGPLTMMKAVKGDALPGDDLGPEELYEDLPGETDEIYEEL